MTNSRNKGATYERELARQLCVWWVGPHMASVPADKLPMRRTPLSGGWNKQEAASDLLIVEPGVLKYPWCFSVEAKNRESWDFDGWINGNPGWPVLAWWKQCCDAAAPQKLRPLLIFTRNRAPSYAAVDLQTASALRKHPTPPVLVQRDGSPFAVLKLEDLLAIDPAYVTTMWGPTEDESAIDSAIASVKSLLTPTPRSNPEPLWEERDEDTLPTIPTARR